MDMADILRLLRNPHGLTRAALGQLCGEAADRLERSWKEALEASQVESQKPLPPNLTYGPLPKTPKVPVQFAPFWIKPEPKPCCGDFEKCTWPCVPRDKHRKEQDERRRVAEESSRAGGEEKARGAADEDSGADGERGADGLRPGSVRGQRVHVHIGIEPGAVGAVVVATVECEL